MPMTNVGEAEDREAMVKLSLMIPKSTAMLLRQVEDFLGPEAGTSAAGRWLLDLGATIFRSHVACECEHTLRAPSGSQDVLALKLDTRQVVVLKQMVRDMQELNAGLSEFGNVGKFIRTGMLEAAQLALDNGLCLHEKLRKEAAAKLADEHAGVVLPPSGPAVLVKSVEVKTES